MGKASRTIRSASSKSGLKVVFDKHVPIMLAQAMISFANEGIIRRVSKGIIWEKADDYEPKRGDPDYIKGSDVPWLDRFAAAGGHAIISGDVKMRERHHEKMALYQHGFVVFFFEAKWNGWSSLRKSALMLHWWQEIATKVRSADNGTFWIVPASWPEKGAELKNASLGLARMLKDKAPGKAPTKRKRTPPKVEPTSAPDDRQSSLRL